MIFGLNRIKPKTGGSGLAFELRFSVQFGTGLVLKNTIWFGPNHTDRLPSLGNLNSVAGKLCEPGQQQFLVSS